MQNEDIKNEIREYIKKKLLNSDDVKIEYDSSLISGGIIDSISTLQMVDFLEKKYQFEFEPHEVDRENLDTIDLIAQFVLSKTGK